MKELSKYFSDRLVSPQEAVVYWTEYVIRHNSTRHLRAVTADTPLLQYFSLDVIFLFVVSVLIILSFFVYLFKKMYNLLVVLKNHLRMNEKKSEIKLE